MFKILKPLLLLCFLTSICLHADSPFYDQLKKAEEYYDAGLFDLAISEYEIILLEAADKNLRDHITLRLAEARFLNEDFKGTVAALKENANQPEHCLLLGKAYNKIGEYKSAVEVLRGINSDKIPDNAKLELAFGSFMSGDRNRARALYASFPDNPLAQIYLARIELADENYHLAHQLLSKLETTLSPEDLLKYEVAHYKGEVYFQLEDYANAVESFEKALPGFNPEKATWYKETQYRLGDSYLKLADDSTKSIEAQELFFSKAEQIYKKLLKISPEERCYLALGQCYLTKGNRLKNEQALREAERVLSQPDVFFSKDAQTQALLLRAQAMSSYSERDNLYRKLTLETNQGSAFYATGWYMRGLNDFEEGEALLESNQSEAANRAFERAANSFKKAFDLLFNIDKGQAALALKYQAQAWAHQDIQPSLLQALVLLDSLTNQHRDLMQEMKDPDEVFYLQGLIASRLSKEEEKYAILAESSLKKGITDFPKGKHADAMLNLLGTIYFHQKNCTAAKDIFLKLVSDYPNSKFAGDALFWSANCVESLGGPQDEVKELLRQTYEKYPHSKYAAEAYFLYYSYREYLQGDRAAIKHLQAFFEKFPESPYVLNAYYLIGLDYKRDRKSPEGKWIRKKNLTAAIDAFQNVESAFEDFDKKGFLPKENLEYLVKVRYRATLERALANLAIAEDSQGAKRQIYLDYARDVFKQIFQEFEDKQNHYAEFLRNKEPYPAVLEESTYWLAHTFMKLGNDSEAKKILDAMLEKYQAAKITRGYFLSRVWYDLGMLATAQKDYPSALAMFSKAEDAAKGKVLTSEQRLDLWIQQSYCCQAMEQLDNAILILSKVINDDSISGLRLKAMYLRAELYELQGRPELARRQLEATSKKGGEWAVKAKAKLENNYAY